MNKHIPNIITLSNLFCGLIATMSAVNGNVEWTAFFVVLGIFFDFFDGFFARLLNVKSELGLQLDSLADVVTSGVVPGIVMYKMLSSSYFVVQNQHFISSYIPYLGLLITLASAYRLANFNIDTRQVSGFIGLPTPANALFVISLPIIGLYQPTEILAELLKNTWILVAITLLSMYMLNANIPLFALKFKDYSFKNNKNKYIFLGITIVLLALFKYLAIPLIVLSYVIMSIIQNKGTK